MVRLYRSIVQICWILGVVSMVAGVVLKVVPTLGERLGTSPRGGLILAGVLFLCALATGEVQRTSSPQS